ncbi:MAG: GntR family transcriptional regulator [Solirubrobacteraceae bacterium]
MPERGAAETRAGLAERAYRELRAAIAGGRLAARTPLSEAVVARMLGVSRTPVRLALRRCELEGYLERDASGRLLVHPLTVDEVANLFFVRELLEGYAARLAALRISDEELERLDELVAEDVVALEREDIEGLARINHRLHAIVLDASRNRTLRDVVDSLRDRVFGLTAFVVGSRSERRQFVDEHARLVGLLHEGDADAAEELARGHLRRARDLLLRDLDGDDEVDLERVAAPR